MNKVYLFLLLGIAFSGCRQKQVLLQQLQTAHYSFDDDLIRVYTDKRGSFYPAHQFYIPSERYFSKKLNKEENGTLEAYFAIDTQQFKKAASHYQVENNSFNALQEAVLKDKVNEILKRWKAEKELVFLVHGFNDPNPSGEFYLMREKIKKHFPKRQFVFVEIYWNGLTANNGDPKFAAIWSKAQVNSMYAALALRKILVQLPEDAKIRIITHSVGASVGTGALFNTYTKFCPPKRCQYL